MYLFQGLLYYLKSISLPFLTVALKLKRKIAESVEKK